MPAPTPCVRRRRARYRKQQKLNALVNGNGSLRIAVRSLDNKSQQQLSDRLHFINTLGKSYISTAFKGLNQHGTTVQNPASTHDDDSQVPEVHDMTYGVEVFKGLNLKELGIAPRIRGIDPIPMSLQPSVYSSSRGNRIDDLMRIAAQTVPGMSGKLYRAPKTTIIYKRAEHSYPFQVPSHSVATNYTSTATPERTQRPNTAPMGVVSTRQPLSRRLRSRQRPATGPATGPATNLGDPGSSAHGSLLLSANWGGLFASRPGTAATEHTMPSSRPGTGQTMPSSRPGTGQTMPTSRPGTGQRGRSRQSLSRQSLSRQNLSRQSLSRGSGSRQSQRNSTPGNNRSSSNYHGNQRSCVSHPLKSRPGTAEHLSRARSRRKLRVRPSTVGNRPQKRQLAEDQSSVSRLIRKEKYWNHKHSVHGRTDTDDDYNSMLQRLTDIRHECNLIGH